MAGNQAVSGANTIFIGANADTLHTRLYVTKSVAIGYNAKVSGSNMCVIGGIAGGADALKVGIGTTKPTYTLEVVGNISASNITASVFGTSSYANTSSVAISSSYGLSSSYSLSSSYVGSSSYALSSSYGLSASYAKSSSYSLSSSYVGSSSYALSASYAKSSSYAANVGNPYGWDGSVNRYYNYVYSNSKYVQIATVTVASGAVILDGLFSAVISGSLNGGAPSGPDNYGKGSGRNNSVSGAGAIFIYGQTVGNRVTVPMYNIGNGGEITGVYEYDGAGTVYILASASVASPEVASISAAWLGTVTYLALPT
jgi:hypothetical protein